MRFSVVTICYNAEEEIVGTMESVLAQTQIGDFEYIVVDGASRDGTMECVRTMEKRFAEKGIPFRAYSAPDKGISDAFNKGVGYAQGEIVALVNAGDCLTPDALKTISAAYRPEVDVYYGNIWWEDEANGVRYIKKSEPSPHNLRTTMCIMHPSCFIRKSAYEASGLYRTDFRYAMDRELLSRMMRDGRCFLYLDAEFSCMKAGGVSDSVAYTAQRKWESKTIALACGVSRLCFEWVYNVAKYRYYLVSLLKRHSVLYSVLLRMKGR